jgi:hypothetical protein
MPTLDFLDFIIRVITGRPPTSSGGRAYEIGLQLASGAAGWYLMLRMLNGERALFWWL